MKLSPSHLRLEGRILIARRKARRSPQPIRTIKRPNVLSVDRITINFWALRPSIKKI